MDKYTMMSLCLMATFGVLILEVDGKALDGVYSPPATKRMINCIKTVAQILTNSTDMAEGTACQKLDTAHGFCRDLYETAKPFYSSYEQRLLSIISELGYSINGYFCHENSPFLPQFVTGKGPECLATKLDEIGNCITEYLEVPLTEGYWSLAENDKKCLSFQNFGFCVIGHLEKCTLKEARNAAVLNIEAVKMTQNCKKEIPAPEFIKIRPEELLLVNH